MRYLFLTGLLAAFVQSALAETPVYQTPQDALDRLAEAFARGSVEDTVAAVDSSALDLFLDPDNPANIAHLEELAGLHTEGYRFVPQENGVIIELGKEGWPLGIPLTRRDEGWVFDVDAGREELLLRQIGRNELAVIEALEGYVAIQRAFREFDHDGDGVLEFASQLISTPGTRDGLYWPGDDSPVGDMVARASLDGFDEGQGPEAPEPFRGYYFRVLQEQGPNAPGGAYSYLVDGKMLAGHAMLAVPAEYGVTGVTTFLVSETGIVMEKDLGSKTVETAVGITSYDIGNGWSPAISRQPN